MSVPAVREHPGTGRSGKKIDVAQPRSIREWLEETADEFMRNADMTPVLPDGVQELRCADDADPVYIDVGGPFLAVTPGPRWFTFTAVLENGDTIETVR